jgi:hypothetical protein
MVFGSIRARATSSMHPTKTGAGSSKQMKFLQLAFEVLEERLVPSSVPLHVAGDLLESSSGQTIVLRGVNVDGMEGWGMPGGRPGLEFTGDDLAQVDNAVTAALNVWHANLIRLPVNQDFWLGLDPGVNAAAYQADVDALVQQASNAGAYVMLTVKVTDGGTSNPLMESGNYSLPDSNTTRFWSSAATHYASNPTVLFDLFNEPGHFIANYSQWKNGTPAGSPFHDSVSGIGNVSYASPGMQGLINAIRNVPGANNIIAAEGMGYADDFQEIGTAIAAGNGLIDSADNLMYSIHIYPNMVPDASDVNSLNSLLPQDVTANYPVYVGEWGADVNPGAEGTPSTSAATWNQNMLSWLATQPYSWTAWAMNAEPWLTIQGTTTPTSYFGEYVMNYLTHLPASTPNPPAPAPASATVQFADTDDWGTGFTGYITISNKGSVAINGWTLQFDFTGSIDPTQDVGIWDAQVVKRAGAVYVIQNDSWDATIAPGASVEFGFNATWANPHVAPSNYVLNNIAIGAVQRTNPTIHVTALGGVYDGQTFAASVSVQGASGQASTSLDGVTPTLTYYAGTSASGAALPAAPSAAGTYTVVASFPGSANYNSASAQTTFTIWKATPTVTVSAKGGIYNGKPYRATAAVVGADGKPVANAAVVLTYYSASGKALSGAPSAPGTYTVVATFPGNANYASESTRATFTIKK